MVPMVNHRRGGSQLAVGAGRLGSLTLLAAALGAVLAAPAVQAGSIFMKNGYIIQGPIVEFSEGAEGAVTLGWPNGKVTIYRRFVEKVDFEPGEERNAKPADSLVSAIPDEVIVTPGMEDELPQSLPELVKLVKLDPKLIDPHSGTPSLDPTPGDLGHEVVGVKPPDNPPVDPVKPPETDLLAGRTTEGKWGFSLEPPRGWKQADVEGCVTWSGPSGPDGFSPSINITSIQKGALKWDEACRALREDQKLPLRSYRLLKEESTELSNRPAFRVAGRGESTGMSATSGKKVTVRQVLVEKGDRLWLISTFVGEGSPENLADALDRSVLTFQLDG